MIFVKSPQGSTPEEELLLQFQGMIAEYERAQIAERCRRGKRYRARSGLVNVLSGAPYGYRYVKKTENSAAYYDLVEEEAEAVRNVYCWYTEEGLSIGEITRRLTSSGIPTRFGKGFCDRSTVWAMLRIRIQSLRKRETALKSEQQSIETKRIDQTNYLRLINHIDDFLSRIRKSAEDLSILHTSHHPPLRQLSAISLCAV